VKILDFGLARIQTQTPVDVDAETQTYRSELHQTEVGTVMGTVGYMSPEQVRGLTLDARSDLFSFGCVLYELISGQRPFQRATTADTCVAILRDEPATLASLGKQVPPALENVIQRCLAKEVDQRFASASDLAEAQREVLMGTDGLTVPPSRLPPSGKASVATPPSRERSEAERLYLAGRYFWHKRTEESLRKSIASFYQALDADPTFALAWAGLADAYHQLGLWGHAPPTSACPKAKSAALRAIELDGELPEAHAALAVILKDYDWDFVGAERAFQKALKLNPQYATAHHWHAECLAAMGRHGEAIAEFRLALDLNPLATNISTILARHGYFYARQYDQAAEQLRTTIAMDSTFWVAHFFLGWVYVLQQNGPGALQAFEAASQLDDNPETLVGLGYAHAVFGRPAEARKYLDALTTLAQTRYVAPVNFGVLCIGLGDFDQAFQWLDRACDDHSQWLSDIGVDPTFDPIRSDSRFASLLRRINTMLSGMESPQPQGT
jgi:tetratricopeptide (TPR) repeat protein